MSAGLSNEAKIDIIWQVLGLSVVYRIFLNGIIISAQANFCGRYAPGL